MSAAIDLAPDDAVKAVRAASSKRDILLRRLDELEHIAAQDLVSEIIPYDGALKHAERMISKVRSFLDSQQGVFDSADLQSLPGAAKHTAPGSIRSDR